MRKNRGNGEKKREGQRRTKGVKNGECKNREGRERGGDKRETDSAWGAG